MNADVEEQPGGISVLDLATTLGEEKRLLFGLPLVAGLLAVVVSLLITPVFTARTTLLPPQGNSGGGAAAAALASLGGLTGLASLGSGATSVDTVVSMLRSRSAKDRMIEQFDLIEQYGLATRQDVYHELDARVRVSADKKAGLITVEVDDEDPQVAAQLANGYYEVLRSLMTRVAVTEAQQRRVFFEQQFAKARDDLAAAEVALKDTQERTGVVELKSQAEATIGAVARLRAEIAEREVQLGAMRTFATAENAKYRQVAAELAGLRNELKKLEKGPSGSGAEQVSAGSLPGQGLEYVRAFREVKYQEAVFEIMAKQFEMAKMDEARDGGDVQQLDMAVPPERKSKPRRGLIVLMVVLVSGFLAVLLALARGALRGAAQNEETRERLDLLKKAWGLRR